MSSRIIPPLPTTERGFPCNLISSNDGCLIYAAGSAVVVNPVQEQVAVVNHHNFKVSALAFSPNASWIATGDIKGNVKIWGSRGERVLKYEYRLMSSTVRGICWSPDSKRLAVCGGEVGRGAEGCCVAYDTGSAIGIFSGHSKPITCVAYRPVAPFRIITGGEDTSVVFHEGPPFKFLKSSQTSHSGFVNAVAFTPDGSRAFSCGNDGIVAVYSGLTGELETRVEPKLNCSIWGLSVDGTGQAFIACGDRKIRTVFDNAIVAESTVREGEVKDMPLGIACDQKAGMVHAITLDGTMLHFKISGEEIKQVSVTAGSQGPISAIEVFENALYVMSVDGTVWTLARPFLTSPASLVTVKKPFKAAAGFLVTPTGLLSVSASNDAELISIPSGESVSLRIPNGTSKLIAAKSAKSFGFALGEKATLFGPVGGAFRSENDQSITSLSVSDDACTVAFVLERQSGGSLLSQNANRGIFVNNSLFETKMNIADIVLLAVSGDGSLIAAASAAHELHVYRHSQEGNQIQVEPDTVKAWTYHKGTVRAMVWVDNRFLVTGGLDKAVYVWDITRAISGPIASLKDAHREGVCALFAQTSEGGKHLTVISGGIEGSVKVTEINI